MTAATGSVAQLVSALASSIGATAAAHSDYAPMTVAADALATPSEWCRVAANCPSIVPEFLGQLDLEPLSPFLREIVLGLRKVAPELHWWIAYDNHDEPDMLELHERYFVTRLVGPDDDGRTPILSDDIAAYLTIQGAGVTYPSHVHKATEFYQVLAGRGSWQKGDRPFEPKNPGDWIHHPTGTRHAMATDGEPMLALAVWTDDLHGVPVIVRD